jgi:hypothetical protein
MIAGVVAGLSDRHVEHLGAEVDHAAEMVEGERRGRIRCPPGRKVAIRRRVGDVRGEVLNGRMFGVFGVGERPGGRRGSTMPQPGSISLTCTLSVRCTMWPALFVAGNVASGGQATGHVVVEEPADLGVRVAARAGRVRRRALRYVRIGLWYQRGAV